MSLLEVRDLKVGFTTSSAIVRAVDGVSFDIDRGETVAIVGESGSGKTQTVLAALGLLAQNGEATGSVRFEGQELIGLAEKDLSHIRGNKISMVFQDPMTSLNPYIRISGQMTEVLRRHMGMGKAEALAEAARMLDAVQLPDARRVIGQFPHELSGGMRQRVMIAMALLCRPKILIADEPTTALDVTVQSQMLALFKDLTREFGTSLVLITHDLGVVAGIADRMMVLYAGRVAETGTVDDLFYDPRHPYTFGLLHSTPHADAKYLRLTPIEGLPPSLENLPPGCSFQPRCAFGMERCKTDRPELVSLDRGRARACWFEGAMAYTEIGS
jgi:oligopeptide transport system ATP-binding protein